MHPSLSRRHLLTCAASALALPAAAQTDPKPPTLPALLARIERRRLFDTVTGLAAFPTRWTPGEGFPAVEAWVHEAFNRSGGGGRIYTQGYTHREAGARHNIVSGEPMDRRGVVLVGAHFDSISETPAT